MKFLGKIRTALSNLVPLTGFHFDQPIVVLQSDDWGRVGMRDREGMEALQSAGMSVGERPYDFYTLETAEDLHALGEVLNKHRDSNGRYPCIEMNFITANLDFKKAMEGELMFLPLAEGLPSGWQRPNLIEAYREGIANDVFSAALHGTSHFSRTAVERGTAQPDRNELLRTLWRAGTPYIYWRMPWIGYEYWDPERPAEERFLDLQVQKSLIGQSVGFFAKLFS